MKGGSVSFVTDVTVSYVTMLRIVTNYVGFFFIYVEKPLDECVDTLSVMQLWVLLIISGNKCLMHFCPISV